MNYSIVGHCPHCGSPVYGPESIPPHHYSKAPVVRGCSCPPHQTHPTPSSDGHAGAIVLFTLTFGTLAAIALAHWW